MQTTFKIFLLCLFCFFLTFVVGCGNGGGGVFSSVPKLTPAEQAEVDRYIREHGRDAIVYYLARLDTTNTDEALVLKYVKYFVSQGANVNAKMNRSWRGEHGIGPLDIATRYGFTTVVDFLVSQGAVERKIFGAGFGEAWAPVVTN